LRLIGLTNILSTLSRVGAQAPAPLGPDPDLTSSYVGEYNSVMTITGTKANQCSASTSCDIPTIGYYIVAWGKWYACERHFSHPVFINREFYVEV
jgi:hypothetical protein